MAKMNKASKVRVYAFLTGRATERYLSAVKRHPAQVAWPREALERALAATKLVEYLRLRASR